MMVACDNVVTDLYSRQVDKEPSCIQSVDYQQQKYYRLQRAITVVSKAGLET